MPLYKLNMLKVRSQIVASNVTLIINCYTHLTNLDDSVESVISVVLVEVNEIIGLVRRFVGYLSLDQIFGCIETNARIASRYIIFWMKESLHYL